jgi:hypothetical protein
LKQGPDSTGKELINVTEMSVCCVELTCALMVLWKVLLDESSFEMVEAVVGDQ